MNNSKYCIGVDLGGTNIAIGLVDLETKDIVKKQSIKTNAPRDPESIVSDIKEVCLTLCHAQGISLCDVMWIGIATPGIVKDGEVIVAFNLGWEKVLLGDIAREIVGIPSYIANDANAAAYAEAIWGAGKDKKSLIAFTIGTGVGGGIVVDGKIWEGINGFAAELGHMVLEPNGRFCACGKRGCIEAYCSATALINDTKRHLAMHPESMMWQDICGDVSRVNGKTVFDAMKRGDKTAKLVFDEFIGYLAHGVSNVINIFQPDVVCIGGGISREGEVLIAPLREQIIKKSFGFENSRTEIVAATFKNDAGIIGAALLGLQNN